MRISKVISYLPPRVKAALLCLDNDTLGQICEIRLRLDSPVCIAFKNKNFFLKTGGNFSEIYENSLLKISKNELKECFLAFCNHSVFAHEKEIREGYISVCDGCRVGIGGNFFCGRLSDIFSLNIRIAHDVPHCADMLLNSVSGGLLVVGAPCTGKTTVLREIARNLGEKDPTCVIDTRKEITDGFYMGAMTDVIYTEEKYDGIEMALRTLSPRYIVFDEIGRSKELRAVADCLNSGVTVVTSAHAESFEELFKRPVTAGLINSGAISSVAIMPRKIGGKTELFDLCGDRECAHF